MRQIFGIVDSQDNCEGRGAALVARHANHPHHRLAQWSDELGQAFLGLATDEPTNSPDSLAGNEDGSIVVAMNGEIYDYANQRKGLESAGHRFSTKSHDELLAHGYEHSGSSFFRELHGKFAAAIWDNRAQRLILVNDRFGMQPLYYSTSNGRLSFSSSLSKLLSDDSMNRQVNPRGLAQFFTFGQLLGDDTLVEGVRLLQAAGWVVFDLKFGKAMIEKYWRLEARVSYRPTEETLDRIEQAFCQAVKRCTNDTEGLGISLSGGMDARTILALAAQSASSLKTLCLGMSGSIDHRSAAAMAKAVGCEHHQVTLDHSFLANYQSHLQRMVQLTDGQYLCQCIVMPTLPVYRKLGIRVLLRGHAGELMHMNKAYNFSLDREVVSNCDEVQLKSWLWRHLQSFMLDGVDGPLFNSSLMSDMESLARSSLNECIDETVGTEPPIHRIWQLFLTQRLRRETALSLVEFDSVVKTRLPYLDNELIDELFAAPPELKVGETIQTHILRRHRPDFLRIVNVNTGTFVGAGPVQRSVARLRQKVLAKLGVHGYQPYERLGLWLRRELRPLVTSLLLNERCLSRGVFDPQTVRRVVDAHLSGRRNHTYLVLALLIFETAQREFIDADNNSHRTCERTHVRVGAA